MRGGGPGPGYELQWGKEEAGPREGVTPCASAVTQPMSAEG